MPYAKHDFAQRRINAISKSFACYARRRIDLANKAFDHYSQNYKERLLRSAVVDDARLFRLGYMQDGQEMRDDYYQYVYDNSFARPMRRGF